MAHHPPRWCPRAHHIEHQTCRNRGHRHKGHQRNGDEIGQCAIGPGAVKMIKRHRRQRHTNHQARQQQHRQMPPHPPYPSLLAMRQKGVHRRGTMQRDNRDHRSEAHLKARPDHFLGPQQHHHQRRHRQQSQIERLPPHQHRAQHQQGPGAGAHSRQMHPRQQCIADPGQRACEARHHRHPHPQRQPRPQRQQPKGDKPRPCHHRAHMQAADRQQMGEARIAHRLLISERDTAAIAAHQRGRDAPRRSRHRCAHMGGQGMARVSPALPAMRRGDHLHRPQRAAIGGKARKPCLAGIVARAGQARGHGWHQPRPQRHHRALGQAGLIGAFGDAEPHANRSPATRLAQGELQQNAALRRLFIAFEHRGGYGRDGGVGNRHGAHQRALCPHQRASPGQRQSHRD